MCTWFINERGRFFRVFFSFVFLLNYIPFSVFYAVPINILKYVKLDFWPVLNYTRYEMKAFFGLSLGEGVVCLVVFGSQGSLW